MSLPERRDGSPGRGVPAGVVFDLDGVLVDSEHLWEEAWRAYSAQAGREWTHQDTVTVQGMSAPEWARHLAAHAGAPEAWQEAADFCVSHLVRRVVRDGAGPLLPGARELLETAGERVPVALASSAARRAIDAILAHHGLAHRFAATVSSEEVARGKPAPDVYLEAVRRLDLPGGWCLAVEDSGNGIRAASAAGLSVVAVPNALYPPHPEALRLAAYVATGPADAAGFIRRQLEGGESGDTHLR